MPSQRPSRKRVSDSPKAPPRKRARTAARRTGSSSQPIYVDTQPPATLSTLSSPPTPSLEALPDAPKASQATPTFNSNFRDLRPKAKIVAPTKGSEEATVALSYTADKPFNREYKDNYNSID
jgi:hypothetical protein